MEAHHRHRSGQSLGKLVSGRCLCPGCGQAHPPHPHSSDEGLGASASCRKDRQVPRSPKVTIRAVSPQRVVWTVDLVL